MSDVTRILSRIEASDALAAEQLLPLVYEELRNLAAAKLAHEKPGLTVQATALVHEAYLVESFCEPGQRTRQVRQADYHSQTEDLLTSCRALERPPRCRAHLEDGFFCGQRRCRHCLCS